MARRVRPGSRLESRETGNDNKEQGNKVTGGKMKAANAGSHLDILDSKKVRNCKGRPGNEDVVLYHNLMLWNLVGAIGNCY